MLALDGGGIRGIVTLGFLKKLETLLAEKQQNPAAFRLCDYFDYIAGTSTGAIIAACLARGMAVDEILKFYQDTGPEMFEKSRIDKRLASLYKSDPLEAELRKTFNGDSATDRNLFPQNLRCLLMVVTRNVTTDSAWPISSNPDAAYNDPRRADCNLKVPLWKIVRASTAAPIYFPPEIVNWDPDDPVKTFTFVDGGVTPYNNPGFLLYRMATHPNYHLNWTTGENKLLLVSVGTGAARTPDFKYHANIPGNLLGLPGAIMYGIQIDQDVNCRMAGRCTYGDFINRELWDLTCRDIAMPCTINDWNAAPHKPLTKDLGRAFLYVRYNADLSQEGLNAIGLNDLVAEKVQQMDAVDQIPNFIRIGQENAARQIKLEHLGSFAPGA